MMLENDAIARYYGLEKGQVVKITYNGGITDSWVTYRCVSWCQHMWRLTCMPELYQTCMAMEQGCPTLDLGTNYIHSENNWTHPLFDSDINEGLMSFRWEWDHLNACDCQAAQFYTLLITGEWFYSEVWLGKPLWVQTSGLLWRSF